MKLTESKLRKITRKILSELFTRKSKFGLSSFIGDKDSKVDPFTYGGEGGEFWEADLEEEEILEELDDEEE